MSDKRSAPSGATLFDQLQGRTCKTWAIVAWNAQGSGVALDGDEWTRERCDEYGCDDHWHGFSIPSKPGVYRWQGTMYPAPPDDYELRGTWTIVWQWESAGEEPTP